MPGTVSFVQQSFPGKAKFTEQDVPDLAGKVTIVTGSNTGLGKEIAQILFSKNAKVYMMARSEVKVRRAIDSIRSAVPHSDGELAFLPLDLADLSKVKIAADNFLQREPKLHLLFNNAGVGYPEKGSSTTQGYELQLGVNCVGTFAFTQHLTPTLMSTAKVSPANSVRVVWVSSSAAEAISPNTFVESLPKIDEKGPFDQYCISKLGNYFLAAEFATRHKDDGVLSMPVNPGNLDSDFWRTQGSLTTCVLQKTILHPPVFGAYTTLFAAFSPDVTLEKSGHFVAPWGKLWKVADDMLEASRTKAQGGTGVARQFWAWNEAQTERFL